MSDRKYSLHAFTPAGNGFIIAGQGGDDPSRANPRGRSRWPMTLVALLLLATTATAAVVAAGRIHAPIPEPWKQTPPSIYTKAPEGAGFRDLLL
jgi:hypothetical protein